LLGLHAAEGAASEPPEALVADTVALLRAESLERIEQMMGSDLATPGGGTPAYREARVLSSEIWRLMLTTHGGDKALVLDTRRDTSPGLAFWHLRACLPAFEHEASRRAESG
jgi:hypothetical protein